MCFGLPKGRILPCPLPPLSRPSHSMPPRLPGHAVNAKQPLTRRGWRRGLLPLKGDLATRRQTPAPACPGSLAQQSLRLDGLKERWHLHGVPGDPCDAVPMGRDPPKPQRRTGVARSFPSLQISFLPPGRPLPSLQVQPRGVCGAQGWQELPSLHQHGQVFPTDLSRRVDGGSSMVPRAGSMRR